MVVFQGHFCTYVDYVESSTEVMELITSLSSKQADREGSELPPLLMLIQDRWDLSSLPSVQDFQRVDTARAGHSSRSGVEMRRVMSLTSETDEV